MAWLSTGMAAGAVLGRQARMGHHTGDHSLGVCTAGPGILFLLSLFLPTAALTQVAQWAWGPSLELAETTQ